MKKLAITGLLGAIGSVFLTFWFWWEGCNSFPCIENLKLTKRILITLASFINAYLLSFFYTVYYKEVIGQFPWSKRVSSKGVLDERSVGTWQPNSIHTYSRVRKMCYLAILCSIGIGFYGIIISNYSSINVGRIANGDAILFQNLVEQSETISFQLWNIYVPFYSITGFLQFIISFWITIKGFPTHKTPSTLIYK